MTTEPVGLIATPVSAPVGSSRDRRGSWIPTGGMIATRFMELRKRRGLMITLIALTIGLPTLFLDIKLLLHGRGLGGRLDASRRLADGDSGRVRNAWLRFDENRAIP